jgi:hypothetical protein
MKAAEFHAPAAPPRPEERTELLESMLEELHEKLDALSWGTEVPAQVARELAKINDTLNWRCLDVLERRLARIETVLERLERKLP